jgi:hypothetical protein
MEAQPKLSAPMKQNLIARRSSPATDGNPNDRNSDIASAAIAAGAAAASPPVVTLSSASTPGVNVAGLHQIAAAGGTSQHRSSIPRTPAPSSERDQKIRVALGCTLPPMPARARRSIRASHRLATLRLHERRDHLGVADAAHCDPNLAAGITTTTGLTEIIFRPKSCDAIGGSKGTIRIELAARPW